MFANLLKSVSKRCHETNAGEVRYGTYQRECRFPLMLLKVSGVWYTYIGTSLCNYREIKTASKLNNIKYNSQTTWN
jgi:hypothetical protein